MSNDHRVIVVEPIQQPIIKVGIPGPPGVPGPRGLGLNYLGAYSAVVNYVKDDLITFNGSAWVVLRPTVGVSPVEGLDYTLFISKGGAGSDGRGILDISLTSSVGRVDTYTITFTDTTTMTYNVINGANGTNGINGIDGISIVGAHIDVSNHLILTMSNASTIDVGELPEPVSIPSGGTTGQALVKLSNTNQDAGWVDLNFVPSSAEGTNAFTDIQNNGNQVNVMAHSTTDSSGTSIDINSNGTLTLNASAGINFTGDGAANVTGLNAVQAILSNGGTKHSSVTNYNGEFTEMTVTDSSNGKVGQIQVTETGVTINIGDTVNNNYKTIQIGLGGTTGITNVDVGAEYFKEYHLNTELHLPVDPSVLNPDIIDVYPNYNSMATDGVSANTLVHIATDPDPTLNGWYLILDTTNARGGLGIDPMFYGASKPVLGPYIVGSNGETKLICETPNQIVPAFLVLPTDVTIPAQNAVIQSCVKDQQICIDASFAARQGWYDYCYVQCDNFSRINSRQLPYMGMSKNGISMNNKGFSIFEFYPNFGETKGNYTGCSWSGSGGKNILLLGSGGDGWGNDVFEDSNGKLSRFTLNETEYRELNAQIGNVQVQNTNFVVYSYKQNGNGTTDTIWNQTFILNAMFTDGGGGTTPKIEIYSAVPWKAGQRIRFTDGVDNTQLIILPFGHTISSKPNSIQDGTYDHYGVNFNNATSLWYIRMPDNTVGDTVELEYIGNNWWTSNFFDLISFIDGSIPWSKISKTWPTEINQYEPAMPANPRIDRDISYQVSPWLTGGTGCINIYNPTQNTDIVTVAGMNGNLPTHFFNASDLYNFHLQIVNTTVNDLPEIVLPPRTWVTVIYTGTGLQVITSNNPKLCYGYSSIADAPNDGKIYVRRNNAWEELVLS